MYIFGSKKPRNRDRGRTSRKNAAHRAKNRRRVNGMHNRKLGQRR